VDTPLTGEVVSFRGKVGWIQPSDPIDIPGAEKRGGKLYTHINDVAEPPLEKGDQVMFYLFKDEAGLGAEEVTKL